MRYLNLFFLSALILMSCQNSGKQSRYVSEEDKAEYLQELEKKHGESLEQSQILAEKQQKQMLDSVAQNCDCNFYFDSEKLFEYQIGPFEFILCGGKGFEYDPQHIIGEVHANSSMYLSGFSIFECNIEKRQVLLGGEINIDSIIFHPDRIEIFVLDYFPVANKKDLFLVPVYSVTIRNERGKIGLDTTFVLNLSGIKFKSYDEFAKIFNDSVDEQNVDDPEIEVLWEFIDAVKKYPKNNDHFKNLKVLGGHYEEEYNAYLEYFRILENQKQKSVNKKL